MLDNNTYNLMAQLVEESQSLWRIRNQYMKDASMCQECADYWTRLAREKEQHVMDLERLVMEHTQVFQPAMAGSRR